MWPGEVSGAKSCANTDLVSAFAHPALAALSIQSRPVVGFGLFCFVLFCLDRTR